MQEDPHISKEPPVPNSPVKMLPLYGTMQLPRLTKEILEENVALGMNTVLVNITEQDFLYYRQNIARVIRGCLDLGLTVRANAWAYGGHFGGEALSATTLHYEATGGKRRGGERLYLNAVHSLGPDAEVYHSDKRITDSPVFQLKRMQQEIRSAGATEWFYDEMDGITFEDFEELANHSHSLGLRNAVCLATRTEEDVAKIEKIIEHNLADEISFTKYFGADSYTPNPEAYLGEWCNRIRRKVESTGHRVELLGWIQGFDWTPDSAHFMIEAAETFRSHGFENIGIWGGYCVDQTPFLKPNSTGIYYDQIAEIFGGTNPLKGPVPQKSQPTASEA